MHFGLFNRHHHHEEEHHEENIRKTVLKLNEHILIDMDNSDITLKFKPFKIFEGDKIGTNIFFSFCLLFLFLISLVNCKVKLNFHFYEEFTVIYYYENIETMIKKTIINIVSLICGLLIILMLLFIKSLSDITYLLITIFISIFMSNMISKMLKSI